MRLRYKLALLNCLLLMFVGIYTWPLGFSRFTFIKYIDPIVLWDFQDFILLVNRVREMVRLPLDLKVFAVAATAFHYVFVLVISTIQWLIIGIICERIFVAFKSSKNAGNTAPPGHPTKSSDSSKTGPQIKTMTRSLCL
jgi:hypothetical protein